MTLVGRLRRGSLVGLLMAVLLVAPMIDCALLGGAEHLHLGAATANASASASHDHHSDRAIGHLTDDCDQHMTHCIVKSMLPAGAGLVLPLLWLVLAGAAVIGAAYLMSAGVGGVRGPPVARAPVLNGQDILARFCISRR
ncbi:putative copper homeostasis (lipo)protein LpqS [Nocardia asiatica]